MKALLAQFHFLHPGFLWLLLALPVLLAALSRHHAASAALARLVDASLLPHLVKRRSVRARWPLALVALAGLLVVLALAGPAWQREPAPLYGSRAAQVVALSLSPRMLATDVAPNRLARARYKVHDLLAANHAGQNGLVAYAGEAFTVAPLTDDAHALGELLDALSPDVMPVAGDDAAAAIGLGANLLRDGDAADGSLVLVTDDADPAAIAAARKAHARGIRVSVLGVGSGRGIPVRADNGGYLTDAQGNIVMARRHDAHLKALADAGGGRYAPMRSDRGDIDALAAELRTPAGRPLTTAAQAQRWRDFGPWLLLPLLPLVALAFRRGWALVLVLALSLPLWSPRAMAAAAPAPASSAAPAAVVHPPSLAQRLSALWLTPDQRAARALRAGDARRAQRLARDPAWQGSAAYRAGDFKQAASDFARASGSDAQYDLGNALARQGRYREAMAAYARALKADPHNADAAANRKSIQDWLRRQQAQRPQSGDKGAQGSGEAGRNAASGSGASSAPQGKQSGKGASQAGRSNGDGSGRRQGEPARSSTAATPAGAGSSGRPHASPAHAASAPHGGAPDAAAAARQQAQARQAREALKRRMDQQLGARGKPTRKPFQLGAQPAPAASAGTRLPGAMQRALQQVPDDPGGLLRRKFMLEYERRHGGDDDGGSPR